MSFITMTKSKVKINAIKCGKTSYIRIYYLRALNVNGLKSEVIRESIDILSLLFSNAFLTWETYSTPAYFEHD